MRRRGRPAGDYDARYPITEKLESLSMPVPFSGCFIWLGALNEDGYGRVKVRARFRRAHIVAWETVNGQTPKGLVIDHACRVRCCINPRHMELVTRAENTRRSNHHRRGVGTKLTEQHVMAIRAKYADGDSRQAIARAFNVARSTVSRILLGTHWKHV